MDLEKTYWFTDFEKLTGRLANLAAGSSWPAEVFEVGQTFSDRSIPGIRVGRGKQFNPVIIAGHHGAEVLGPYGCLALLDTLLNGVSPNGEDLSAWAESILSQCTVTVIPLVNVDGAIRMRELIPSCDFCDRYSLDAADWDRYDGEYNEPRYHFRKLGINVPLYGFAPEQIQAWRATGRAIGLRYSDQGIDLFYDYKTFLAPETRAVRDFLKSHKPCAILEIHNHEPPSRVFVPVVGATTQDGLLQLTYGEEMMTRLAERGIPCSRHSVRTYEAYSAEDYRQFPEFAYQEICPLVIFAEICTGLFNDYYRRQVQNHPLYRKDLSVPPPTRRERILTGWSWMHTFLDLGVKRHFA